MSSPWWSGPGPDGSWVHPDDKARIQRHNAKLKPGDKRRVVLQTESGHHVVPGQWSGNPWEAKVVVLLMNPSTGHELDAFYSNPEVVDAIGPMMTGNWDPQYPNAWLSPKMRKIDGWNATVAWSYIHKTLVEGGMESEAAWQRVAQRCCLLELAPYPSLEWSSGVFTSTTKLSVELAQRAYDDPDRLVLLCRGENEWKAAGLLDADLLPKSKGVRMHQCRITPGNFPDVWDRILQLLG